MSFHSWLLFLSYSLEKAPKNIWKQLANKRLLIHSAFQHLQYCFLPGSNRSQLTVTSYHVSLGTGRVLLNPEIYRDWRKTLQLWLWRSLTWNVNRLFAALSSLRIAYKSQPQFRQAQGESCLYLGCAFLCLFFGCCKQRDALYVLLGFLHSLGISRAHSDTLGSCLILR